MMNNIGNLILFLTRLFGSAVVCILKLISAITGIKYQYVLFTFITIISIWLLYKILICRPVHGLPRFKKRKGIIWDLSSFEKVYDAVNAFRLPGHMVRQNKREIFNGPSDPKLLGDNGMAYYYNGYQVSKDVYIKSIEGN